MYKSMRDKFLGLSLQSTRKSYYPQLQEQLEAATESERRLQLLIDSMPARIAFINKASCYVFVNKTYEKDFGLKRDQIVGMHMSALIGNENYAVAKPYIAQCLQGQIVHYESAFKDVSGGPLWLDVTYVPDTNQSGACNGLYVLVMDITEKRQAEQEKRKLEEQLRQIQKFEAIATLAGGIAHDFNNLLMGVQGRTSLMMTDLDETHPFFSHLSAIHGYVDSAANLTGQLLGLAKGGKYEVKPMDINALLFDSVQMFGRTHKEISVSILLDNSTPIVQADSTQMEQVLLNLYVNAWQAMPDGGDLFVETATVVLDQAFCQPHKMAEGAYAKISVTDTGIGMDEGTCRKVFDPFFTTKKKGRGTGLGLASAFGIITNHGGCITVYSEKGRGATFNIYLPLSTETVHQEPVITEALVMGNETILLVDDEMLILEVAEAMLERLGYQVIVANGGEQAVEIVTRTKSDLDLVILDLIMPGMDGGRTFEAIRKIRPNLPILLSSGYAINGQAHEIMEKGCNGFIQKPFNLSALSKKIREILSYDLPRSRQK